MSELMVAKPPPVAVEGSLGQAPVIQDGLAEPFPALNAPRNVNMVTQVTRPAVPSLSTGGPGGQRKHNQTSSTSFHPATSTLQTSWEPTFLNSRQSTFSPCFQKEQSQWSCLFPSIPHVCCGEHRGSGPSA